jgi:predicted ArsR family transcriptional regulator
MQNSLKMKVLALIREHPEALTDELIALKLDLNPSTARPRRIELAEMGLIESHGTAPTTSGRKAQLWRATPTIEA